MDAPFQFQSHNDDLVGFFTSLPQQRILEDVQDMIQRYCRSNRLDIATAVMSVPSRTHKYHQPSIQGKVSFADQPMVKIQLKHVLDIVKMSFDLGIFHVAGLSFRQTHGTAIGNQISPVLSGISVSKIATWLGLPTPNRIETHHSCTLRWQSVYIGACAHFDQTRFAPRFSTIMWQRFLHPTSWAWTCQRSRRIPWIQNQPQCSTYQFHFTFGKMAAQTSAQCWFSTKQIISFQCQSSLDTSSWIPQDTDWSGSPSPCQTISWIQGVPATSSTRWKVSLDRPCSGAKFCP